MGDTREGAGPVPGGTPGEGLPAGDLLEQARAQGLVFVSGAPREGYCDYHGGRTRQVVWQVEGHRARGCARLWICGDCLRARHEEYLGKGADTDLVNPKKET